MTTVSTAAPAPERENLRMSEWTKLNKMLESKFYSNRLEFRQVTILSKLYFVPEGKAVETPNLWMFDEPQKRYVCPSDDGFGHDPYNRLVSPRQKDRLVCDNGFNRHEWWQNAAFWWNATQALGLRRSEQHLNDLVDKKHTFWSRGHQRDVFTAVQIGPHMAEQVNRIGIENGSVSPWKIDESTLRQEPTGQWTFQKIAPKAHKAREGDWLCANRTESRTLYGYGAFAYNRARIFPQKFFAERARFIDELH